MATREFGALESEQDELELRPIQTEAFGFGPGWDLYVKRLGRENFRLLRDRGRVVAGLGFYRMGQWFGGRSVPMAGVAAVAVPPELRGAGLAVELMTRTLQDLAAEEMPLSALYPATQRVYRKVGYEQAGFRMHYQMALSAIQGAERGLEMRQVEAAQHGAFHEMYRRWASTQNGVLDRNTAVWERLALPRAQEIKRASTVGPEGQEEGYIVFHQAPSLRGHFDLKINDLIGFSAASLRRLFTFLADHRSVADHVSWYGAPGEPALFLLPEVQVKVEAVDRWMLRLTHVQQALELRGYPADADAELHLEVGDSLLEVNRGRFVLSVSGGKVEVSRGGRGEMKLDVQPLAPLYSGFMNARQLQRIGLLEAPESAMVAAETLFAGPTPWMPDMF